MVKKSKRILVILAKMGQVLILFGPLQNVLPSFHSKIGLGTNKNRT